MLPDSLAVSAGVLVVAILVWRGVARGTPWPRIALQTLFTAYITWVVTLTVFPVPLVEAGPVERALSALNRPNLVPLRTIVRTLGLESDWQRWRLLLGNVLVFVPFGLLAPVLGARLRSWPRALLVGLVFSGAVELAQLVMSRAAGYWYRMPDVDDLLLNVAGVALGYGLFVLLKPTSRFRSASATPRRTPRSR